MTKVEQKAFEAYPDVEQKIYHGAFGTINFDRNAEKRKGFIKGYQQAKKDLEVKEVDFEKELDRIWFDNKFGDMFDNSAVDFANVREICRHFFELGLNTQQNININITNIDKVIEKNGVDPNSKEAKMFKESYYVALEKLKAQKGE